MSNGDFANGTEAWAFGEGLVIFEDPDIYRKGQSAFIDFAGPEERRSTDVGQPVAAEPIEEAKRLGRDDADAYEGVALYLGWLRAVGEIIE